MLNLYNFDPKISLLIFTEIWPMALYGWWISLWNRLCELWVAPCMSASATSVCGLLTVSFAFLIYYLTFLRTYLIMYSRLHYINYHVTQKLRAAHNPKHYTSIFMPPAKRRFMWRRLYSDVFLFVCWSVRLSRTCGGGLSCRPLAPHWLVDTINKKLSYRWQTARCWIVKLLRYGRTFCHNT